MQMSSEPRKKLAIIDGMSVFYRGFYAMPNLTTKEGIPTGGVFGFTSMALELIKKLKPDYVCVAWDKPKTSTRKRLELYPGYKAGRKTPPEDFYIQIPILHELLEGFSWPLYELDDYEADDIMGTLAMQANEKNIEVMLITSDLDLLQCVGPLTHVYALKKGFSQIEEYRPESFEQKYGLTPAQFLDLKAIKGDSSDKIPGVPGIGEKGAVTLLQQYKTLDGVYDNVELVSGSTYKKLVEGKKLAYLSRELAKIWCDAPIKLDLTAMDVSDANPHKIRQVLQNLEFKSLVRLLPVVMQIAEGDESFDTQVKLDMPKATFIRTAAEADKIDLSKAKTLVVHARSKGAHGRKPTYLLVSDSQKTMFVFDIEAIGKEQIQKVLKTVIEDETVGKIGYDIKSTMQCYIDLGIELRGIKHDVFIGAFLINSLRREQTLTELAASDLGYEGSSLELLDDDEYIARAPEFIGIIRALHKTQFDDLAKMPKVAELAKNIEWPVISVLARMEYEGIELDCKYLNDFNVELTDQISDLREQIYGHADQEFNISSPSQLAEILFDKLQLPTQGVKKGKTSFSTAANELVKLRPLHPIVDLITQYREVTKLQNTYVETLPRQVDERSRLHTTYSLTVAQTGRLSSNDPNLQNIPVRTELGKHIRTAFIAGKGKMLVSADYSQFELRLAAAMANDKDLIDMFNRDVDVHTATAAQVYGREPEDVTKNMRRDAKVINFGILYGMSPHGLSVATGMNILQAKKFIDKYFEMRKPILEYMNELKEIARTKGYVETIFGRRRPMPDIHASNFIVRQAAERAAINMPIQGTEADLMKMAMVVVEKSLPKGARMLLQIHDSILVECDEKQAEEVAEIMKNVMETIYELPVKLTVDTSIGKNWGEL